MAQRKAARASQYITTTVDVEVNIADYLAEAEDDELDDLGLHREDSCPGGPDGAPGELYSALEALHQQAHPDQPLFVDACLREPCRSLSARRHPGLAARR